MAGGAAGSGEAGEPRSEAGHQGRGLEGEEGGEVDTREVVTRPREEHFVFDLAGNLREKGIVEFVSLLVSFQCSNLPHLC